MVVGGEFAQRHKVLLLLGLLDKHTHTYISTRLVLLNTPLSLQITEMAGAAGLGFHPHFAGFWHRFAGKTLGATMWFWMMYRAKQDGPVLLVKCHGTHFCRKSYLPLLL